MRKISIAMLLALLLTPVTSFAGQISVSETVSGLDAFVTITGAAPNLPIEAHLIGPGNDDTMFTVTSDPAGSTTFSIPGKLLSVAGTYRVVALFRGEKVAPDAEFTVMADKVDANLSLMNVSSASIPADGTSVSVISVILKDMRGNPLSGRPVQLVGSRAEDRITPLSASRETDDRGQVQFAVQTQMPGEILLRAMDVLSGTMLASTARITAGNSFTIQPSPYVGQVTGAPSDVLDHFSVVPSVSTVNVGEVLSRVTVTALDRNNQIVKTFTGPVKMNSSDAKATLPGFSPNYGVTFKPENLGVFDIWYAVSFSAPGTQTLSVTDMSGTVRGEAKVTVTGRADASEDHKIVVTSPKRNDVVNSRSMTITGTAPAFVNLEVRMSADDALPETLVTGDPAARGETDASGSFSIPVTLPNTAKILLKLQDDSGRYDSAVIPVSLDTKGPSIEVSFDPAEPKEGESVAVTVSSNESGLREVVLKLDNEVTLTESTDGTYQGFFPAPKTGTVKGTVVARDSAGNVTEKPVTLNVVGPDLPQVQEVRVTPIPSGFDIAWAVIPDETITGYDVEVGRAIGKPDYQEETDASTLSVTGLTAATEFAITVRAKRGGQAGPRSAAIIAKTPGMEFAATPGEGEAFLQWTMPDPTPLSAFKLGYWTADTADKPEVRLLDGAMRAFTLSDLLPLEYTVEMIPVTVTGVPMEELIVRATVTPLAPTSFRPTGGLTVRTDDVAPPDALHGGAPSTTDSGIPGLSWKLILGLTAIVGGLYVLRRRKKLKDTENFLRDMAGRYHRS